MITVAIQPAGRRHQDLELGGDLLHGVRLRDATNLLLVGDNDQCAERESWRGLGDERLLRRYARERATPAWAMGPLTEGLLQLFAQERPVIWELRNRGLTHVIQLAPVKRWLVARALES